MSDIILRRPLEDEIGIIEKLQSSMLRIIRESYSPQGDVPINVCIYTAFPETKISWENFSSYKELKMHLWLSFFPAPNNIEGIHNSDMKWLNETVKKPRNALAVHHWKKCRLVWNENTSVSHSEQNPQEELDLRFEFDYVPCYKPLNTIKEEIINSEETDSLCYFKLINDLDDYYLTSNQQQNFYSICFARIPYLCVPLVSAFIPTNKRNRPEIASTLSHMVMDIQPVLASYAHSAIHRFAKKIDEKYWRYEPGRCICSILALSLSSALFPKTLEAYEDNNSKPFLRIFVNNIDNNLLTKQEEFPFDVSLPDLRTEKFRIRICFVDHENPYLEPLERVKEMWLGTESKVVCRISKKALHSHQWEIFQFGLRPIITALESIAALKKAKQRVGDLQIFSDYMGKNLKNWSDRLEILSNAEVQSQYIFQRFSQISWEVTTLKGGDLNDYLVNLDQKSFEKVAKIFSNSGNDFKHTLQGNEKLGTCFSSAVKSWVQDSLQEFVGIHPIGKDLTKAFCAWIGSTEQVTLRKQFQWPIFVHSGGIGDEDQLKSVLKHSVTKAINKDNQKAIKVNIGQINGYWRCDLPIFCFICEVLFESRYPTGGYVDLTYQNDQWKMSWHSNKEENENFVAILERKNTDSKEQNTVPVRIETLKSRLWFLKENFGRINGRFSSEKDGSKHKITMGWKLEP